MNVEFFHHQILFQIVYHIFTRGNLHFRLCKQQSVIFQTVRVFYLLCDISSIDIFTRPMAHAISLTSEMSPRRVADNFLFC